MKQVAKLLAIVAVMLFSALPMSAALTSAEQMPTYPGGINALMEELASNIVYPETAVKAGKTGRVIVQFVVERDGTVGEVKVVRSVHPDLDNEAVRVVKSLSKRFTPGRHQGKTVAVWFTLPINFDLNGK